jgi:N-acetylmuramoyl-L-alanine amidase
MGIPLMRSTAEAEVVGKSIPQVLARRSARLGAGVRVDQTSFPLGHLAVAWSGPGRPAVRVRSVSGWGDWQAAHACGGAKNSMAAGWRCSLLTASGAVGYEVASDADVGELSVTELNTVHGPARTLAGAPADTLHLGGRAVPVRYLSRAAWGADESLRLGPDGAEIWPPTFLPVQTLTVHHTATANSDRDPAATVRAIYFDQAVTQGFGDIGYHLLIDEAGTVYEGRSSGTDPMPVFGGGPGPDGRPQMVDGGHVLGFNAGNVGVALLGDLTNQLPTRAARRSLGLVLAALAGVENLDPLATTNYVNPINGATKTVNIISGHRDWAPTECPGNRFYPQLASLRRDVARLLK